MGDEQSLVEARRRSVNARSTSEHASALGLFGGVGASMFGGTLGTAIGLPVVLLSLAGLLFFARHRARQFNHENLLANDALHAGELAKAATIWDYWSDLRGNKQIRLVSRHNLATVWTHQGNFEKARKLHQDNSDFELKTLRRLGMAQLSATCVGYCHALEGDLDEAARWLDTAKLRSQPPQLPNAQPMVVYVSTIVALRRGRPEEAAKLLEDNWQMIEARVVALSLRSYRLLRAFARVSVGPREAGRAHDDVESIRPRYVGEYSFLGTKWPELHAFLATHQLV